MISEIELQKYIKVCPDCKGDGYNVFEDDYGNLDRAQCHQCRANGYFFDMYEFTKSQKKGKDEILDND